MKQLLIGVVVGVACAGVVSSQTERFELEGNLKFFGTGNGIIFADGTTQVSAPVLMIGGGTIFDPGKTDYGALFGDSPWGLETESMTPRTVSVTRNSLAVPSLSQKGSGRW